MRMMLAVCTTLLSANAAFCCDATIGASTDDLLLPAQLSLSAYTCIKARTLVVPDGSVLTLEGHRLDVDVAELRVVGSAIFRGFDYSAKNLASTRPPIAQPDKPIAQPSYDPGPTNGQGQGRKGGSFPLFYEPKPSSPGEQGQSAGQITINVSGTASGRLRILNMGINGQRGANGAKGPSGGNGEQGHEGRGNPLCSNGPGWGGMGGRGMAGDHAGDGGNGGNAGAVRLTVNNPSPAFLVEVSAKGGFGGAPGLPGGGGSPGLQGCGGRGGPCLSKEFERQGVMGLAGAAGFYGRPGLAGQNAAIATAGEFRLVNHDQAVQCAPMNLSDEEKVAIDSGAQVNFWALAGYRLLGTAARMVEVGSHGQAVVITPDWKNGFLSFIDPTKIVQYILRKPPSPGPIPSGCTGPDCCVGSPSIECLNSSLWRLSDNPNGVRRYRDRLAWRDKALDLLHVELASVGLSRPASNDERSFLKDGEIYLQLNNVTYLKVGDEMFARLAVTLAGLMPSVRAAQDARVRFDLTTLQCSAGDLYRIPSLSSFFIRTVGAPSAQRGWNAIFAQSSPTGFQLNSPTKYVGFAIIPIASWRSETIIERPFHESSTNASKWSPRPGFHEGGFCNAMNVASEGKRDAALNCGGRAAALMASIRDKWRSFDTPSLTFLAASLLYIDAATRAEGLDLASGSRPPEMALHCIP